MKKVVFALICIINTKHVMANTITLNCAKTIECKQNATNYLCHMKGEADKYFGVTTTKVGLPNYYFYLSEVSISSKYQPVGKSFGICTYLARADTNLYYKVRILSLPKIYMSPDFKASQNNWIGNENDAKCKVYAGDGGICPLTTGLSN